MAKVVKIAQFADHLARPGQIGVEAAEVDAVLQGEDVGLVVQLQAQLGKFKPCKVQSLNRCRLIRADHIPVVHIHPCQRQVQLLAHIVHEGADVEHRVDVARLVSQGQALVHGVDVSPHQRPDVRVGKPGFQRGLEPPVVDALEEVADVALDDPALGVVPFLHGPVGQTGGLACCLVRALPPQEIGPHVPFQHLQPVVGPLAVLGRVGVQREAPGQLVVDDVIRERVLHHLVPERRGLDKPLLGFVDIERVQQVRLVRPLQKRF